MDKPGHPYPLSRTDTYLQDRLAAEEAINTALREENEALHACQQDIWFLCTMAVLIGILIGIFTPWFT
jgi:hypothetical protein